MPDRIVRYIITGDSRSAVRAMREVDVASTGTERKLAKTGETARVAGKHAETGGKGFGKLGSALGGLAGLGRLGVAGLGIGGLAFGFKDLLSAGEQFQSQQALLQNALRNTGNAGTENLRRLTDAADKLATHGGFAPPQAMQSLAQLLRATGSVTKAQNDLSLATNIARGTHKDFGAVTKAVAMVEQGRTTGLARLGIVLPKVTAAQDALKASGVKSTPAMLAQAKAADALASKQSALTRLQKLFGGSTQTFSKTAQGATSNFKNSLDILNQRAGAFFLPAITKGIKLLTAGLNAVMKWIDGHKKDIHAFFAGIGTAFSDVWKIAQPALKQVGGAISAIIPVVLSVGRTLLPVFKTIGGGMVTMFKGILQVVGGVFTILKGIFTLNLGTIWKGFKDTFGGIFRFVSGEFHAIWGAVKFVFDKIGQAVGPVAKFLTAPFRALIRIIKEAIGWIGKVKNALDVGVSAGPFQHGVSKAAWQRGSASQRHAFLARLKSDGISPHAAGVPGYASGGYVGGPGSGRDTQAAMLTPGEFVLRPEVVSKVGSSALNSLNATGRFAGENDNREIVIPITLTSGGRVLATETTRYALRMQARR